MISHNHRQPKSRQTRTYEVNLLQADDYMPLPEPSRIRVTRT